MCLVGVMFFVIGSAAPANAATTHDAVIQSFQFVPNDIAVTVGDTVRWTNLDGVGHNVSGGPLFSGNFASGSYSHTFIGPGTFSYICTLHSGMSGQVVVADVPAEVVPETSRPVLLGVSALVGTLASVFILRRRGRPTGA